MINKPLAGRHVAAVAVVLILGACRGSETTSDTVASDTTESAPSSTKATTTTETTSTQPPTTSAPVYDEISRDTALAVNTCLDQWRTNRLLSDSVDIDDLDSLAAACELARDNLDIDLMEVPLGDSPVRRLAVALAELNLAVSFEKFRYIDCPDVCATEDPEAFLAHTPADPDAVDLDDDYQLLTQTPDYTIFGLTVTD
jgi:hypothetical protein